MWPERIFFFTHILEKSWKLLPSIGSKIGVTLKGKSLLPVGAIFFFPLRVAPILEPIGNKFFALRVAPSGSNFSAPMLERKQFLSSKRTPYLGSDKLFPLRAAPLVKSKT